MKVLYAAIYVDNMAPGKVAAMMGLTREELMSMTGFDCDGAVPCTRDDCLVTWSLNVDDESPTYEGDAFAREDFIAAVLDIVEDVK